MLPKSAFFDYHTGALWWIRAIILFMIVFSVPCSSAAGPLNIYVVNYPLKYFAERIGGDHVKVEFPVTADVDPAYWNPDLADISAFQKADLILLNGAGYAKWMAKVSLPRSNMVDTSRQFKDRYITTKEVMTHSHGGAGEHAHEDLAFTTWLDFELADRQAKAIAAAMGRKRPELRDTFQNNFKALAKDLKALDQDIQAIVSQKPSTPLIVSHPVYDYFARRYGLNIVSVHWEPDQVPRDNQLREFKGILKQHPAQWMIWEGKPVQASVDILKTLGVDSLVFDPCGNVPDQGDFMTLMRENVENLRKALPLSD
ncbi:MAG: metal ABC transporter substrate-binding protein [Deltaproteobacteria bacterium]|nr:metal ABC transporter substrate-binding protein [Deltaproteobacteria bacterium]